MQLITTDAGQVKVGNVLLPGVFESLEITAAVQMDQVEIEGSERKGSQAVGFDNATLRLNIVFLPKADGGDCIDQVRQVQQVFRSSSSQQKPGVYRIVNKHAQARGINQVIFSDFKTLEDNRSDKVVGTCVFEEYTPIKVKVAQKTSTGGTGSSSGSGSGSRSSGSAGSKSSAKSTGSKAASSSSSSQAYASFADFRRLEQQQKKTQSPVTNKKSPSIGSKILNWIKGKKYG